MSASPSANTTAILLLTAPLLTGAGTRAAPTLTAGEYGRLARRLYESRAEPADLLAPRAEALIGRCAQVVDPARMRALLERGLLLSHAVERWHARAIWVVSRADAAYPSRLKARLRTAAPAILYGCGARGGLSARALAIVGSREAAEPVLGYARDVAAQAARAGVSVVSGHARGIDRAAMHAALAAGGTAVGVLPGDLERRAMHREHRNLLLTNRLVLLSPYDPSLEFDASRAMERNRIIYALADAALVADAAAGHGGTWAGAVEQVRGDAVSVFVRSTGERSEGLDALRRLGARPWPNPTAADQIAALLRCAAGQARPAHPRTLQFSL